MKPTLVTPIESLTARLAICEARLDVANNHGIDLLKQITELKKLNNDLIRELHRLRTKHNITHENI